MSLKINLSFIFTGFFCSVCLYLATRVSLISQLLTSTKSSLFSQIYFSIILIKSSTKKLLVSQCLVIILQI